MGDCCKDRDRCSRNAIFYYGIHKMEYRTWNREHQATIGRHRKGVWHRSITKCIITKVD